ncbi:MAG: 7-cyano-7-deazaguanine synthase [Burkholderiales bacterium]|nr:7-cyano-7-deazaguanine synthase [Burkholderiales bacterium]
MASNERVILCGGLTATGKARGQEVVPLLLWGKDYNVTLKVSDISQKMVANVAPELIDLLEIATYVYCADQATTRGGNSSQDYGAKWRRQLQFHIPVREPELWSSKPVRTALCATLGFLSDDEYEFTFKKLARPPPADQYLDFGAGGASGFQAEEVVLFSGGLDSLAGAVQEAIINKRSVALVSHRSSPKIDSKQKALVQDLLARGQARQPFHVPVWVNKEKALGKEYTQRTRSFLFASLGAVVARIFDLWRIRFYENGVVSINLPISPQVVGGRATRTTHPQVLNGFAEIFSAIFQKPFAVENPFRWMTKAEVVKSIRDGGGGDLIKHTVSCTHVWEMTTLKTHCGTCSQCIDRRFGTLAAGCPDSEDPEEMYAVDLMRGERPPGDSRTMLESYVGTAKRVRGMTDTAFFTEFGEAHRVTRHIQGMKADDAATGILGLYKRHASQVAEVIARGIREHAQDISDGKVPSDCLLILALPDEYKRPATFADEAPTPLLILDEIKDGETNRGLLARVVGNGRFEGVNKKIGSRELFFVALLFGSTRAHNFAGYHVTVVPEGEVSRELLKWSDDGYLKFAGKDRAAPSHRVLKMWGEFVRQIEMESNLRNLFTNMHKSLEGERLYGIRLRPKEKRVLVTSIPALFRKPAAKVPVR